jgi:hypothetical protein
VLGLPQTLPAQSERYDRHAEAVHPAQVRDMTAEQVTGFFLKHTCERRLIKAEFRQLVDAVQLLAFDLAQAYVS